MSFKDRVLEASELKERLLTKERVRQVKLENRPKCVICGEKVGRCVMRRPK